MGGGGGSSGSIGSPYGGGSNRNPDTEWPYVNRGYGNQIDQFNQFVAGNPLLNTAGQGALANYGNLGSLIGPLQSLQQQVPGFFSGLKGEIGNIQGQVPGLQNQLSSLFGQLGNYSGSLGTLGNRVGALATPFSKFLGPNSALNEAYGETIAPTLRSGGALTSQGARDVSQATRAIQAAQGTAHGNAALGTELLNRESAQQQRFNNALGQSQGVLGQQSGATGVLQNILGQQANIYGQRAGIAGQQAGITGQQTGLLQLLSGLTGQKGGLFGQQVGATQGLSSGQQGLQTGGLNQLIGTSGAQTSQFSQLTNPILSYIGNLFGGNQQSQIAQAQINAQQQAAGDSKMGSTIGGGISAIGSIAAIAL